MYICKVINNEKLNDMNQMLKKAESQLEMVVQWVRREERLKAELVELSSNKMPSTKTYKLFLIESIEDCIEQREKLLNEVITIIKQCHE